MQKTTGTIADIQKFKPSFTSALYKTEVNVVGKYLSGLLIIKKMPDSSTRIVFSNEMGITFFDFEFTPEGKFKVFSIVQQMNKKAVIKTLRKDFELILMQNIDSNYLTVTQKDNLKYYSFPLEKGFNHYITDRTGNELVRMENASKRKPIVQAIMKNYMDGIPDTIGISHTTFNFTIGLKRIHD
jgi:hypothetical protein